MEANSQSIINAFYTYSVPLTVGVITGDASDPCYVTWLKPLYQRSGPTLLEIASHSVTHQDMRTLTPSQQYQEVANSKSQLDSEFGINVALFIPPYNTFDNDTISALVAAGYKTVSPQCAAPQINETYDGMCTSSMYPYIRPSFFPAINGIVQIPCGAATTAMDGSGGLLSPSKLFNGTYNDCALSEECSINSQIASDAAVTDPKIGGWSVVMVHPQDFDDGDDSTIQSYFRSVLPVAKENYDLRLVSSLPN